MIDDPYETDKQCKIKTDKLNMQKRWPTFRYSFQFAIFPEM
jgi:hypothetical protein